MRRLGCSTRRHRGDAPHHRGRKQGRSTRNVRSPADHQYAQQPGRAIRFDAMLECDDVQLVGNVFQNASAGTRPGRAREVGKTWSSRDDKFLDNGWHNRQSLWADGLTVKDVSDSQIMGNEFRDDTDMDLIFGGGGTASSRTTRSCTRATSQAVRLPVDDPQVVQQSRRLVGHGYLGNVVDGGPNRNIRSGIYVASEEWYNPTPYRWTTANPVAALIHDDVVTKCPERHVHRCTRLLDSRKPVPECPRSGDSERVAASVSSPTLRSSCRRQPAIFDFRNENVAPTTRHLFESQSWIGRIPNWPF